jgi:glycosyltransferase involved in cell wall biosynthesis
MRVLVSAYSCEPGKGSEPGVGWHWVREIAAVADEVVVLTRANNRRAIESASPPANVEWQYIDLLWATRVKRGQRRVRVYYLLWQLVAARHARALHRTKPFDLVHHLTWATSNLPIGVAAVSAPLVVGPVGGGVGTCWRLWRTFGLRGAVYEVARTLLQITPSLNPVVAFGFRRARVILAQNPETAAAVERRSKAAVAVVPNAGVDVVELSAKPRRGSHDPIEAVFVGRAVAWKGLTTAVRVLGAPSGGRIRLTVAGEGPDIVRARRLADSLGVADRVRFVGQLPRHDVLSLLDGSDVFLFPTQHDEGPLAVVEAMARGVRPVVLDRGGPQVSGGTAGCKVSVGPAADLPERLARAVLKAAALSSGAAVDRARVFEWNRKRTVVEKAYRCALGETAGREIRLDGLVAAKQQTGRDASVEHS